MSVCYKEYTLIYTCYGVNVYGNGGFIQSFPTVEEAIEYVNNG